MDAPIKPRRLGTVWVWSALAVLIVAGAVGGVFLARNARGNGKKKSDREGPPASPVELSLIQKGSISTWLETTTSLEPRNSAALVARGQGEVVEVRSEEGRWVERGAILARLDDTDARLAVERADLAAQGAKRDADRGHQLATQGFLSPKELDDKSTWIKRLALATDVLIGGTAVAAGIATYLTLSRPGRSEGLALAVTPGGLLLSGAF